eukprot:TRINITY_DN32999_c0_g1_i1.p1 TRINITY_DN32999_c0_g1~~TRINITY_DN32999_c0_g1_i1.p1  ORF type:complete len:192 (-),score=29.16 TRINITY_DN32999_c0_g1_i1:85-660(-)
MCWVESNSIKLHLAAPAMSFRLLLVCAACVALGHTQNPVTSAVNAELLSNGTSTATTITDAEYAGFETKSKLAMILLQMFHLGLCGIDRCYMGNTCCGIVKFLSLGGCGIWVFIDMIIILINCFEKKTFIDSLGFQAQWKEDDMDTPYYLAIFTVVMSLLQSVASAHQASKKGPRGDDSEELEDTEQSDNE